MFIVLHHWTHTVVYTPSPVIADQSAFGSQIHRTKVY